MSGQPLTGPGGLESWCDRDLDTITEHYQDMIAERNMQAARQRLAQTTGG